MTSRLQIEADSDDLAELYQDLEKELGDAEVDEIRRVREAKPGGAGEGALIMIAIEFGVAITVEVAKRVSKLVGRWMRKRKGARQSKLVLYSEDGQRIEVSLEDLEKTLVALAHSR